MRLEWMCSDRLDHLEAPHREQRPLHGQQGQLRTFLAVSRVDITAFLARRDLQLACGILVDDRKPAACNLWSRYDEDGSASTRTYPMLGLRDPWIRQWNRRTRRDQQDGCPDWTYHTSCI